MTLNITYFVSNSNYVYFLTQTRGVETEYILETRAYIYWRYKFKSFIDKARYLLKIRLEIFWTKEKKSVGQESRNLLKIKEKIILEMKAEINWG